MDYRELSKMELETQSSPLANYEFRVFIADEAFDRICNGADKTREVGGILVGEVLRDAGGPFLRVDTVIEALYAEERGMELTLTHATWNHIHEQMDNKYVGKRIVGWYHTHPDFGIFLSDRDQFIQQSFFDLPFQIALVYDPVRREHGIFTWRDNKPWRARQYWIGGREHIWDAAREPAPGDNTELRASAAKAAEAAARLNAGERARHVGKTSDLGERPPLDFFGTLIVGVICLLLGLTLGPQLRRLFGGQTNDPQGSLEARAQGAQEAVANIDADLMSVIRGTLSDEALAKTFDEGLHRLDNAVETIKPLEASNPSLKPALQSVYEAHEYLTRARNDRQVAHQMLTQLSELTKLPSRIPQDVARDIEKQRVAIGGLYAELARESARAGDKERTAKLLAMAAELDPDGRAEYERQFQTLGQQETAQPQPAREAGAGRVQSKDRPVEPEK